MVVVTGRLAAVGAEGCCGMLRIRSSDQDTDARDTPRVMGRLPGPEVP